MNDQTTTPSHVSDQETPSIPRGRARRLMAEIIAGDLQVDQKDPQAGQEEDERLVLCQNCASSAAEIKKANKNILAIAGLFAMAAARDGGCIEIADGVFLNCHRYLVESEDWDAEVASQAPFWITDTNLDQIPVQDEHDGRLLEIIREAAQTTHARGRL